MKIVKTRFKTLPTLSDVAAFNKYLIEELVLYLKQTYYAGVPIASDEYYDAVEEILRSKFPNSPILKIVGTNFISKNKVKHQNFIGSLDTVKDEISLLKKIKENEQYIIMPKFDGMTCVLTYKSGILVSAATRGNGIEGENILHHCINNPSIPNFLTGGFIPKIVEIRGEALCYNDIHKKLGYANRRNAISGILRRKEACEPNSFIFIPFEIYTKKPIFKNDELAIYNNFNFKTILYNIIVKDKETFNNEITKYFYTLIKDKKQKFASSVEVEDKFNNVIYDIDGLVIKRANSIGDEDKFAWKIFQLDAIEKVETKVTNIEFRTSRTRNIFPRIHVEPVKLGGVVITHITGASLSKIEEAGLGIGSKVLIYRANGVIPKIYKVITKEKLVIPTKCPNCKSKIIRKDSFIYCSNKNCSESEIKQIIDFFKKLNIKHISDKTIRTIINEFFEEVPKLKTFINFIKNENDKLHNLKRFGKKKVQNIVNEINRLFNNEFTLIEILSALNLPNFNQKRIEKYCEQFNIITIEDFIKNINKIQKTPGIGKIISKEIINYINKNKKEIIDFFNFIEVKKSNKIKREKINKIKYCITGKFNLPRKKIITKLKKNFPNFEFSSVINKSLNFLIADKVIQGKKIEKAKQLNIPIIRVESVKEIEEFLNENY